MTRLNQCARPASASVDARIRPARGASRPALLSRSRLERHVRLEMSRAFARALPVAIAAVLRAGTARAGEDVALARALTAPRLSSGVYCMWQAASFGTTS